jgi:hypothetical protein
MRHIFLFFCSTLWCSFHAQMILPVAVDSMKTSGHKITLNGVGDYSATSVPFSIFSKFLFGGHISEKSKTDALERHRGDGRIGGELFGELQYANFNSRFFGEERLGWVAQIGWNNFNQMGYSKDAFQLAFFGNQSFGNDEILLDRTFFTSSTFHKAGWGLMDKKTGSFLILNAVGLQNQSQVNISNGRLLLTPDQDSLNFLYNGYAIFSEGSNAYKGIGLSLDFNITFRANAEDSSRYGIPFQFTGRNLGWVHAIGEWKRYQATDFFPFDGFTLTDALNDVSSFSDAEQVLDTLKVERFGVRQGMFLPGVLQISKVVDIHSKKSFQTFFGLRTYLVRSALPFAFVGADYRLQKNLHVGLHAGIGGFTYFRGGFYANYQTAKFNVGLAAENIYLKNGLCTSIRLQWAI